MQLDEYQELALRTAGRFDSHAERLSCSGLGLAGETGEVIDLIKKRLHHPHKTVTDNQILEELGDVLWYAALLSDALGVTLSHVAMQNIAKLAKRYPNGFPNE